jgi:hypothetical protein
MTPRPLTARASVYIPAFGAGVGHTRWVERGWGIKNILEDARHSSVLYICKYCTLCFQASEVKRYTPPSYAPIPTHIYL